jgi:gamma-aminobutyric acid receptor subunit beta
LTPVFKTNNNFIRKRTFLTEYASVGYMAKRIQMRKNRFLALQKMAEQKKNEMAAAQAAMNANNSVLNDVGPQDMQGIPKQTVSFRFFLLEIID